METHWPTPYPEAPTCPGPHSGPHSEPSLGHSVPPAPLGSPHDQWVHPTHISFERAFPPAPAADVQAFPAGPQTPPTLSLVIPPLPPHPPPALWNEFTKVPLCLPGTLPFSKSKARMVVWRSAGASCDHSWALQGQFQEYESQFPLGPMHRAEMSSGGPAVPLLCKGLCGRSDRFVITTQVRKLPTAEPPKGHTHRREVGRRHRGQTLPDPKRLRKPLPREITPQPLLKSALY